MTLQILLCIYRKETLRSNMETYVQFTLVKRVRNIDIVSVYTQVKKIGIGQVFPFFWVVNFITLKALPTRQANNILFAMKKLSEKSSFLLYNKVIN